MVKNLIANTGDTRDTGLMPGLKDPLEYEMETCSSVLIWKFPWAGKPGGLQSMGP